MAIERPNMAENPTGVTGEVTATPIPSEQKVGDPTGVFVDPQAIRRGNFVRRVGRLFRGESSRSRVLVAPGEYSAPTLSDSTSIGQESAQARQFTKEEVRANAMLEDEERKQVAANLLLGEGKTLTAKQQQELIDAHTEASDELGGDETPAGVYNYNQKQIWRKAKKLPSFSPEQRRTLMESGLAGGADREPEPTSGPEWENSPERGRWLVEQVTDMEARLPYEVRWNAENAPKLYELSDKLIKFVENTEQRDRNNQKPLNLEKEHQIIHQPGKMFINEVIEAYKEMIARVVGLDQEKPPEPENLTGLELLPNLITKLNNRLSLDRDIRAQAIAEYPQTKEVLLKYFREAKRKDLLRGVDAILNAIYLRHQAGGVSAAEIRKYADDETVHDKPGEHPQAYYTAESEFLARTEQDPTINDLYGVWEPYLRMARTRLEQVFKTETWNPEKGEWRPPAQTEGGKVEDTFWDPYGGYPDYYTIRASKPAEFRTAMETFLQMVRNNALGYAPDDLMQNLTNFKRVLSARAALLAQQQKQTEGPDKMTADFAKEIRQEFEGRSFLWYTFYQYEHYNKDNAKSGATAMALHEGPQRYIRTLLAGEEAEVGFHTKEYDYSPEIDFALNAQGSRGQFGERTQVQEYIRNTIFQKQVEKGMGVILKDYDWRDPIALNAEARRLRAECLEQIENHLERHGNNLDNLTEKDYEVYLNAIQHSKTNRDRIASHQSAEAFKSLYEGFDHGDTHRSNYRNLDPKKLPKRLQRSVKLGMIQVTMDTFREDVRNGVVRDGKKVVLKKGDNSLDRTIDRLVEQGMIRDREKRVYKKLYEDAYDQSKAGFEVAQQMEGITHESTIRDGGKYFLYRNKYSRAYWEFRQQNQKVSKANDPDISDWSPGERATRFTTDQYIGWILDEIRLDKRFDGLTLEEKYLYCGLGEFNGNGEFEFNEDYKNQQAAGTFQWMTPVDRAEVIVDEMAVHKAEEFGMAAVNWIRMQYADDAPIWQRPDLKKIIEEKSKNGEYRYRNFRAIYRAAVVEDTVNRIPDEVDANGFEAKLNYAEYDYDLASFDPKKGVIKLTPKKNASGEVDLKPMRLKRPHIFGYTQLGQPIIAFDKDKDGQPVMGYDRDGNPVHLTIGDFDENNNPLIYKELADVKIKDRNPVKMITDEQGKNGKLDTSGYVLTERKDREGVSSFVAIEEVNLDFPTALDSYLALHTTNTYSAYQSNYTHTLTPLYVFEQARQIRDGQIRVEDADILAGLLLTVDPTLCRVKGFRGDRMSLETLLFDAAVEESLMGSIYVKDALKKRFLPTDGDVAHMRIGYYTEDRGGDMGFSMNAVARAAKMPKRWARRFTAALANTPIYADSMARNLGRKGVTGAVSLMADNIYDLTGQRILSQFGITKFINLVDSSSELWFRLVGGTDPKTGIHHEGLFMKPTNNADKLTQLRDDLPNLSQLPISQSKGFYAFMETFGRAWDTLRVIRTMYSDNRNAGGALLLDKKDIFLPDGRINPDITPEKNRNTGTSRHIAERFWNTFVDWLVDEGPGGGQQAYKDVAHIYKFLEQPYFEEKIVQKGERYIDHNDGNEKVANKIEKVKVRDGRTWADWLFDKMAL